MVSENIGALAEHFLKYRAAGVTMEPPAVTQIAGILLAIQADVQVLEASRISPVAMAGNDLPANVVKMTAPKADTQGGVA